MIDDLFRPDPEEVHSVTALTRQIKGQLEHQFNQLWVRGEVSNLRRQSSGHVYFSLKDSGSQLPCVLFARDAAAQSFQLEAGMEVLLFGSLSVYEPHGRYQLIAKMAIPGGQGRLHLEFERLKKSLAAEGLFDRGRKQALPSPPRRIAVITSPSGAAVRDFLRILRRRDFRGEVVVLPARVQGRGAAEEIAAMLEIAERSSPAFDLVVLTRGGGSIEDLWAFNEEPLVRRVAACATPLLSAVGHEIDTVLTDYAADVRAETPSGAAELISSLFLDCADRLERSGRQLTDLASDRIEDHRQTLRQIDSRMQVIAPARRIEHLGMRLDELENALSGALAAKVAASHRTLARSAEKLSRLHPAERIRNARQILAAQRRRLARSVQVERRRRRENLDRFAQRLENSSLQSSLRRGYAILKTPGGRVLDSAQAARAERELIADLRDGSLPLVHKDQ